MIRTLSLILLFAATLVLPGISGCEYPTDSPTPGAVDADGDGYVSAETGGTDCDDTDAAVHPGADDTCDGFDTDCDGVVDSDAPPWWIDRDGDSWGDVSAAPIYSCASPGDSYAERAADCNDHNVGVNPGEAEKCDGIDQNCNGVVDEDTDDDGYAACEECDPANPSSYPGVDLDGDGYSCDEECLPDSDDYKPERYPGASTTGDHCGP